MSKLIHVCAFVCMSTLGCNKGQPVLSPDDAAKAMTGLCTLTERAAALGVKVPIELTFLCADPTLPANAARVVRDVETAAAQVAKDLHGVDAGR